MDQSKKVNYFLRASMKENIENKIRIALNHIYFNYRKCGEYSISCNPSCCCIQNRCPDCFYNNTSILLFTNFLKSVKDRQLLAKMTISFLDRVQSTDIKWVSTI